MWDFDFGKTLGIMLRTMPFILTRMAIYFGITLAYVIATGAGAGIGYGVGHISDDPATYGFWGGGIGFVAVSAIVYWLREYILYMVKAAHIAVMVEMIDGRPLPAGQGQVEYGREIVTQRFAEANVLFALDQLVKGVLRAITGIVWGIANFLPIPGLDAIARVVNTIVRISLTYVDEIILAYNMRLRSTNPWETSRQALVLYAQNGTTMIRNAVWLTLFLYMLAFFVFMMMLTPAAAILYMFPGQVAGWSFVIALIFAWAFKAAVLEPFAIAALTSVFFKVIEGQEPNPEWDAKLASASNKFRELKDRALEGFHHPA